MSAPAAPADELDVPLELVRRLLDEQHPQWASLPLTEVRHNGTDHAMVRLGPDLAVRLPRVAWAVRTLELEQRWLPRIAEHLPVPTPVPVAIGAPAEGYPWPWTVCRWVHGTNPEIDGLADPVGVARDLGGFVTAMRTLDPSGAPTTVWPLPLHEEDPRVRAALPALRALGGIDVDAVVAAWDHACAAAPSPTRTWIHGDLAAGNLLLRDHRLSGVVDFSAMGLGDPASDLRSAWNLLPATARADLRATVGADDAEWARGRGWALLQAVAQLDRFTERNPWLAGTARRVLTGIAEEVRSGRL